MTPTKKKRGFAAMDPEKRKELARKGGQSVPKEKRYFSTNKDAAASNGARGGRRAQTERRIRARKTLDELRGITPPKDPSDGK
jgi:general stress protein YciG